MVSVFPLLGNIYLKLVRIVIISITCLYRSEKKTGSHYCNFKIRRQYLLETLNRIHETMHITHMACYRGSSQSKD